MQKNLLLLILLLFHAAWSVQIIGTREFGTQCDLKLCHVPSTENVGAFKISIRIADNVDISSVMTDAASGGAWAQIKPGLSCNGNLLEVLCVGPALMRSRLTDTVEMCRITFNTSEDPGERPLFNGIIDSIWFSECIDTKGEATALQFSSNTVAAKQIRNTASLRKPVEYRATGRVHSLSFLLSEQENVKAWVVDARGRIVSKLTNKKYGPGLHTLRWPDNNRQFSTGTYFIQLELRNFTYNKKVNYYR